MLEDNISYYRRRAEAELERAQKASCPEALRPHFEMANVYLARIAAAETAGENSHVC